MLQSIYPSPTHDVISPSESSLRRSDTEAAVATGAQTSNSSETDSRAKSFGRRNGSTDSVQLSQEAEEIRQLQMRDREVRAHEAAHAATGGAYAGSPSYTISRGPDGRTYATGGEVRIDISPVKGDPQATLKKAEQVRAAALAPAEPSGQDLKVAQKAQAMAAKARIQIAQEMSEELNNLTKTETDGKDSATVSASSDSPDPARRFYGSDIGQMSGSASLSFYS